MNNFEMKITPEEEAAGRLKRQVDGSVLECMRQIEGSNIRSGMTPERKYKLELAIAHHKHRVKKANEAYRRAVK